MTAAPTTGGLLGIPPSGGLLGSGTSGGGLLDSRVLQFALMNAGAGMMDASRAGSGRNPFATGMQAAMQGMFMGHSLDEHEREEAERVKLQEVVSGGLKHLPQEMQSQVAAVASVNPVAAATMVTDYLSDRDPMYEPGGVALPETQLVSAVPAVPRVPSADGSAPIWQRHNNPGNLRPPGSSTGFQTFGSMDEGVEAARNQLNLYWTGRSGAANNRRLQTVEDIVSVYAPPNENDTQAYIQSVAADMGVAPDAPLTREQATSDRMLNAMFKVETGGGFQLGGVPVSQATLYRPAPSFEAEADAYVDSIARTQSLTQERADELRDGYIKRRQSEWDKFEERRTATATQDRQAWIAIGRDFQKTDRREWVQRRAAVERIINNVNSGPTGYRDAALITDFAKSLDPGSVVRNEEFETIASQGGLTQSFLASIQNAMTGKGMLTPAQRRQLAQAAIGNYEINLDDFESDRAFLAGELSQVGLGEGLLGNQLKPLPPLGEPLPDPNDEDDVPKMPEVDPPDTTATAPAVPSIDAYEVQAYALENNLTYSAARRELEKQQSSAEPSRSGRVRGGGR